MFSGAWSTAVDGGGGSGGTWSGGGGSAPSGGWSTGSTGGTSGAASGTVAAGGSVGGGGVIGSPGSISPALDVLERDKGIVYLGDTPFTVDAPVSGPPRMSGKTVLIVLGLLFLASKL